MNYGLLIWAFIISVIGLGQLNRRLTIVEKRR